MATTLFGTEDSVYVRIVRLVLHEKKIIYDFVIADVFSPEALPASFAGRHPFGQIPAIEIDRIRLYETDAIVHYIEALHPDPPLLPADPLAAARARQIMRVIDNHAYRALVWGIYVPVWWREGREPDVTAIAAARLSLAALDDLIGAARLAPTSSLAGFYLGAVLATLDSVEAGSRLLDGCPHLRSWWDGFRGTPAMVATRSPQTQY